MDCNAARLLLSFRQNGPDAPADADPEAADLRDHLDGCPECDALYRAEARLDAHFGRAVRDVPVPVGLKGQILSALAADRADALRKRIGAAVRGVAAAAAVLLVASVAYWFLAPPRPKIDASEVHLAYNLTRPTNAEAADARLKALGFADCAPEFVDYAYLSTVGVADLPGYPGHRVPQFGFVGRDGREVIVLAVNDRRYEVTEPEGSDEPGYKYRVRLKRQLGSRWVYLVFYTGDDWKWLEVKAPAE